MNRYSKIYSAGQPAKRRLDLVELNFAQQRNDRISAQALAGLGILGFFLAWVISVGFGINHKSDLLFYFLVFTGLPMVGASIVFNKTHLRASTGLKLERNPIDWRRCRVKFIGFLVTLSFISALYYIIPEYARQFYTPVWRLMAGAALPIMIVAFPYIVWVDRRMAQPEDGYWHCGRLIMGKWRGIDCMSLRNHWLGWFIKAFFLPFMLGGAAEHLDILPLIRNSASNFDHLYASTLNIAYTIDIMFGSLGYLLTLRIIDSHIKSVEPTVLGWISAMSCYVPFSTLIWANVLAYKGKTDWSDWLARYPLPFITWGFIIMVLTVIYVWSTCMFGCRFSNLTNRGIVVHGPYQYFKHPAYLSKNIAWWMMSVPFVSHHGFIESAEACFCLLITNAIYYVRAWTEERHLLHDPAYRVYCDWIKENGFVAQVKGLWTTEKTAESPAAE